jgi:hypothetical protein
MHPCSQKVAAEATTLLAAAASKAQEAHWHVMARMVANAVAAMAKDAEEHEMAAASGGSSPPAKCICICTEIRCHWN